MIFIILYRSDFVLSELFLENGNITHDSTILAHDTPALHVKDHKMNLQKKGMAAFLSIEL